MSWFHIDTEKCDKDGACAMACPTRIITMSEKGPEPLPNAASHCLQCGHCAAICPKEAFHLHTPGGQPAFAIQTHLTLDETQMEQFLRSRRSIRRFNNRPVEPETFQRALGIAACAPTAGNFQPVKWLVINDKNDIRAIGSHVIDWMRDMLASDPLRAKRMNVRHLIRQWENGVDMILRDAPLLAFTYASDQFGLGTADCHTALAYLELALPVLGMGSCWAGYVAYAATSWQPLLDMLGLEDGHTCHGGLMAGYPVHRYHRVPDRKKPVVRYYKRNTPV